MDFTITLTVDASASWIDQEPIKPKESKETSPSFDKKLTWKEKQFFEELDTLCLEEDKKDLEYFKGGYNRNKYNLPFFDLKDLLITINPKTGRQLTPFQRNLLLNSFRNNETYKRYKKSSEQITDNEILLEQCRNLYNVMYKDFNFDSL